MPLIMCLSKYACCHGVLICCHSNSASHVCHYVILWVEILPCSLPLCVQRVSVVVFFTQLRRWVVFFVCCVEMEILKNAMSSGHLKALCNVFFGRQEKQNAKWTRNKQLSAGKYIKTTFPALVLSNWTLWHSF